MKLVSFDVGLRNLAFCVMEGTNRSNLKILHWDLIDVMAEAAGLDKPKCHKCKKPANWVQQTTYACKTHTTNTGKPPTKKSLTELSISDLTLQAARYNLSGKGKKELVDMLYTYHKANVWTKCVKSSKQVSVVDLADPIAKCLAVRKQLWANADLIAFEQQPDKRMLCVQAMLHMWFVCQGYKCKGVSATHKLTNIVTIQDATKTYKGRKSTGIVHATELVKDMKWREYMLKHPKKDDLADCFLQGLWVVEH